MCTIDMLTHWTVNVLSPWLAAFSLTAMDELVAGENEAQLKFWETSGIGEGVNAWKIKQVTK
jgi:hypothetical protein